MKEKEVQKALGLLKKYTVEAVVNIPHPDTIAIPFRMNVEATTEEEANEMAKKTFAEKTLTERKKFVFKNIDEYMFGEMNTADLSVLNETAERASAKEYSAVEIGMTFELDKDEEEYE